MNRIVQILLETSNLNLDKISKLMDKGCFSKAEYKEFLELLGWSKGCIEEVVDAEAVKDDLK